MSWIRTRNRRTSDRIAVVDGYRFPAGVRQRFSFEHSDLGATEIATVEDATRQWFRLAVAHPKARLAMPSVIVDDLWHEMVLHTRDYAEFCDAAFGHFFHHVPESAMTPEEANANRFAHLGETFRYAQQDEYAQQDAKSAGLPLLFRVDRDLSVKDGRRYLADCGGRGECYELPGTLCLLHLTGTGTSSSWSSGGKGPRDAYPLHGDGGGPGFSGCAGGCGGGT